ncbi:MAG: transport permease protein [Deltaproteobacteria bacterium]|jgi:lipopolysaccharide transport system permease protein|nr:MAG: transport permease protein [Deltaproteobacteria bacterium]
MQLVRRLYPYKDLFLVFTWREFTIRYRQSIFGILWAILQPLSMMILFTFIFSYVLKIKLTEYPNVLFFYAGLLPWTFFSSSLNYSVFSLSNQYDLITKIYFPREIIPLSGISIALLDYLIASLIFWIMLLVYKIHITWNVLWIVPLFILLFLFTTSMSLLLSSINVYYRDVKLATGFLIQLLFFASPVIYSTDRIEKKLKVILFLNPLTFIIENMRRCILEGRGVIPWQFITVSLIIGFIYFLSYRFFIRMERDFADVI